MTEKIRSIVLSSALCAAAMAMAAGPVQAQRKPTKNKTGKQTQKKTRKQTPKKVKTYEFTPDEIDGDRVGPGGMLVITESPTRHGTLIRYRNHFLREIVKSGEDL